MNDYEIQKIRDTAFCSGYNTAVSKYEKQSKELQKENAELKAVEKMALYSKMSDKLTKAKEYIKLLLMNCVGVYESTGKTIAEIQAEAEQFLKECEK